jgi:selenide,water dikinase
VLQPLRDTFKAEEYPDLLVGLAAADDAAVYRLSESEAIVTTTDFFPPVVDNAYDFGAIAAANALSDIYAMGGKPLFALNLVAFPSGVPLDDLREILRGGAEKVAEAGAVIAGGHSVSDKEPKYGLAVVGIVNPTAFITKGGSKAGDLLILTKPLGTGIVTTALKRQQARVDDVAAAVDSMKQLNHSAAEAAKSANVKSMTDITGFGLLGHAHEMAHLSMVKFRFYLDNFLWLPGALDYGKAGSFPGGMTNNLNYFSPWVEFAEDVPSLMQDMLWTPETSGGLLVAISPEALSVFKSCYASGVVVGEVLPGEGQIEVVKQDPKK